MVPNLLKIESENEGETKRERERVFRKPCEYIRPDSFNGIDSGFYVSGPDSIKIFTNNREIPSNGCYNQGCSRSFAFIVTEILDGPDIKLVGYTATGYPAFVLGRISNLISFN